jgi:undecaprenyl pyrophosphate synthase
LVRQEFDDSGQLFAHVALNVGRKSKLVYEAAELIAWCVEHQVTDFLKIDARVLSAYLKVHEAPDPVVLDWEARVSVKGDLGGDGS